MRTTLFYTANKSFFYMFFLFFSFSSCFLFAQEDSVDYDWQWAHLGGGKGWIMSSDPQTFGSHYLEAEQIKIIRVDKDNNYYYLGSVQHFEPVILDQPIDKYSNSELSIDLLLMSTDCEGNFRWSVTIGSCQNTAHAYMDIDTLGGVYVAVRVYNSQSYTYPHKPDEYRCVHFSPNDSLPPSPYTNYPVEWESIANMRQLHLLKYDTDGNFLWNHAIQDTSTLLGEIYDLSETQKARKFKHYGGFYGLSVEPNGTVHWLCLLNEGNHVDGNVVVPPRELIPWADEDVVPINDTFSYHSHIIKFDKDGNYIGHVPTPLKGSTFSPPQFQFHRDHWNGQYYFTFRLISRLEYLVWDTTIFRYSSIYEPSPITPLGGVFALDSVGNEIWRQLSDKPVVIPYQSNNLQGSGRVRSITTDEESNVYISGSHLNDFSRGIYGSLAGYTFTADLKGPFLMKLDAQGNFIWASHVDPNLGMGTGTGTQTINAIITHGEEVIATGLMNGVKWGDLALPRSFDAHSDLLVIRFNKHTGAPIKAYGLDIDDPANMYQSAIIPCLAVDRQGNYVVGGATKMDMFMNHPLGPIHKNVGAQDLWFAKLGKKSCDAPFEPIVYPPGNKPTPPDEEDDEDKPTPSGEEEEESNTSILEEQTTKIVIYPNPTDNKLHIHGEHLQSYEVHNLIGQSLMWGELNDTNNTISLQELSSGTYFIRVKTNYGNTIEKIIKK